jgi:hypothetical protein
MKKVRIFFFEQRQLDIFQVGLAARGLELPGFTSYCIVEAYLFPMQPDSTTASLL